MSKEEVLQVLLELFREVNAIDPNLTDDEAAEIKLKDLAWFDMTLDGDEDFKKEDLYNRIFNLLKDRHPNHIPPEMSPQHYSIFEENITIGELDEQIAENTPYRSL